MDLVATPKNPIPLGVSVGYLKGRGNVRLRYARWPSAIRQRHGTVCIFPGRSEFIEKYFEVVGELRRRGFAVAVLDWRGQGLSERALTDPLKGHVGDFAEYERDLDVFMNEVVLPDCPPPLFAVAHSMGASVLIRIAKQGRRWFDRMVLSAPMIDLPGRTTSFPARALLKAMRLFGQGGRYVPGGSDRLTGADSFINNPLTSDPVRYARNAATPTTTRPRCDTDEYATRRFMSFCG